MIFLKKWTMEKKFKYVVSLNGYELYRATTSNVPYNNEVNRRGGLKAINIQQTMII